MILADFGAEVIRIDRVNSEGFAAGAGPDDLARGKRSIALNLKSEAGKHSLKMLVETADVIVEPFRPGAMERLGLGPGELMAVNPRLIYARMTGFGQGGDKTWAEMAGHDANYLAISGMLSLLRQNSDADDLGATGKPFGPLNLLGDFAGGGMVCAMGILLSVIERHHSGKGQVIDAAMVDGASYIGTSLFKQANSGRIRSGLDDVGRNGFNQGAHWYTTYECSDGKFVSVCSVEPKFYRALLAGLGLDSDADLPKQQMNRAQWPAMKRRLKAIFLTRSRDQWTAVFCSVDACVTPVLDVQEAQRFEHNVKRGSFYPTMIDSENTNTDGGSSQFLEPAPAPHLSRTPGHKPRRSPQPGEHTAVVLAEAGMSQMQIDELLEEGAASMQPAPPRKWKQKLAQPKLARL
jgi:alpha-methylacyl-CoA racemase